MEYNGYYFRNLLKRTRRKHALTAGEQALYAELVDLCNEEGWTEYFQVSNKELEVSLRCSEKTLGKWRDQLVNAGLIHFTSGQSKRIFCTYTLTDPSTVNITANEGTNKGTNKGMNKGTNEGTNRSDYYINKTEQNETRNINIDFEAFWNLYEKKVGRNKSETLWKKLTNDERSKAIDHIPAYKISTPDITFRKNPETYLRNRSFNDQIINQHEKSIGSSVAKTAGASSYFSQLGQYGPDGKNSLLVNE